MQLVSRIIKRTWISRNVTTNAYILGARKGIHNKENKKMITPARKIQQACLCVVTRKQTKMEMINRPEPEGSVRLINAGTLAERHASIT
jgi:hypothetical protein